MKGTKKSQSGRQWLAVALVAASALIVLGVKALNQSGSVAGFKVADTPGQAAVPTLGTQPPEVNADSGAAAPEADPFPQEAGAQVEWVLRNHRPAMILFHSTTCKACLSMGETFEKLRPDYEAQVVFIDVIVTDKSNAELLRQAQIKAIPTTVFLTASGDGYGFMGAVEEQALRAELTKLISGGA